MKLFVLGSSLLAAIVSSPAFADFNLDVQNAGNECTRLMSVKQLDPIRQKIALTNPLKETTFEMTVNASRLPASDRPALAYWVDTKRTCFWLIDRAFENYPDVIPPPKDLKAGYRAGIESLAADLYQRKITIGDFNKRYKEMAVLNQSALQDNFARVQQQLQQQAQQQAQQRQQQAAQAEAAQRDEENRAFERKLELIRMLTPKSRETTNCRWGSTTLNCTTTTQ